MTTATKKANYNVEEVKSLANGRWGEAIASLSGIDSRFLTGRAGPCPKCGGKDRWRFTNKGGDGSAICNQCFRTANGDGISVLQWLRGFTFPEALSLVAEYFGVKPQAKNGKSKKAKDPGKNIDFGFYAKDQEQRLKLWTLQNPGVSVEALKAVGAIAVRYRQTFPALALPILGRSLDRKKPVGWLLIGKDLPILSLVDGKIIQTDKVKTKVTAGSKAGVIAPESFGAAGTLWKLEGPKDLLTFLSVAPEGVSGLTNAFGAGENPAANVWIPTLFQNRKAFVCHDCDEGGQEGATYVGDRPGWAPALAEFAEKGATNVVLPYAIAESGGKDLRDYLTADNSYGDLLELAEKEGVHFAPKGVQITQVRKAADDPGRLADVNLLKYANHKKGATLAKWRGEWFKWAGKSYEAISTEELEAKLFLSIEQEFDQMDIDSQEDDNSPDKERKDARKVSSSLLTNVLKATAARVTIPSKVERGTWLDSDIREPRSYLAVQNGILDVERLISGDPEFLVPHSPKWFSTVCLPYSFDPEATCPKWLAALDRSLEGDQDRIAILQEWAGYLLLPETGSQAFLMVEGKGANGKSVYMAGITAMLGLANCSFVPLEAFSDRFSRASTLGKLANISADAGQIDSAAESLIKGFVGGEPQSFDRKNLAAVDAVPTARLMIACNNRPRIADRTDGVWRRLLFVPFNFQIPIEERVQNMDKFFWWEKSGECSGILNWAIIGLERLRRQSGNFTISALGAEAAEDYRLENNPVAIFLQEFTTRGKTNTIADVYVEADQLYSAYRKWAESGGYRPVNRVHFGRIFKNETGISKTRRRIAGVRTYVFEGVKFSDPGIQTSF